MKKITKMMANKIYLTESGIGANIKSIIVLLMLLTMSIAGNTQVIKGEMIESKDIQHQSLFLYGSVDSWQTNDNYVYNSFVLQTKDKRYVVYFQTHIGKELTSTLKIGKAIVLKCRISLDTLSNKEARLISIVLDGKTIVDTSAAPLRDTLKESFEGNGRIVGLQNNKEKKVNGLILQNNIVLHLSSVIIDDILDKAVEGADVKYAGVKQTLLAGEVSINNTIVIDCKTITIGGKQYMSKE